jgi:hypothetical protein
MELNALRPEDKAWFGRRFDAIGLPGNDDISMTQKLDFARAGAWRL